MCTFPFCQSITRNPILSVRYEMALLFFSVGQAARLAVSHKKSIVYFGTFSMDFNFFFFFFFSERNH